MSTLLHTIVADAPRLEGALCYGEAPRWDAEDTDMVGRAIALCQQCPALQQCETWLHSLPAQKRSIVVTAGEVIRPPDAARKAS